MATELIYVPILFKRFKNILTNNMTPFCNVLNFFFPMFRFDPPKNIRKPLVLYIIYFTERNIRLIRYRVTAIPQKTI